MTVLVGWCQVLRGVKWIHLGKSQLLPVSQSFNYTALPGKKISPNFSELQVLPNSVFIYPVTTTPTPPRRQPKQTHLKRRHVKLTSPDNKARYESTLRQLFATATLLPKSSEEIDAQTPAKRPQKNHRIAAPKRQEQHVGIPMISPLSQRAVVIFFSFEQLMLVHKHEEVETGIC
ncbi:hypothetical protein TNIN_300491 [Trichonephila inaurata madagascariensis]|uniref:Uncharacterized protein n=1 Tax=Trichonephila inaurata madagascariensis TaxID=2747483 RepID=A0A8X6WWD9_9ARAC|nr:hypothetical protein TNIN_300491 [Trichonephila inaurata madagascariensis]